MLFGLLGLLLFVFTYFFFTAVSGTELNTHSFEVREFSFRRDPLTNYQLSGIKYEPSDSGSWSSVGTNPKSSQLDIAIKSHLSQPTLLPQRWDLIQLSDSNSPGGGATILVELLNARDQKYDLFWPKWSIDNSSRASELWPAVQQLVEFRVYAKLPELLELALLDNSLTELKASLATAMQSTLVEQCRRLDSAGDKDQARLAAQAGLKYGDNSQLQAFLAP